MAGQEAQPPALADRGQQQHASIQAKGSPMQLRAPAPNGK
jgi:hypothetical protein